ncbi:MAG: ABC transporter permease [Rhodobacteraceae bacterium]|nr:ABC transporter permease [Paracoccaceae bacterium]
MHSTDTTPDTRVGAQLAAQRRRRWRDRAIGFGAVMLLIAVWEVAGHMTPDIFLSPFHRTLIALYSLTVDGTLIRATQNSLIVLFAGLAASVVVGVVIGLLMGRYERAAWVLEPYVNGLYAAPTIAFLPLVTLWLGLYTAPKIAIVVLIAVFPILKNTYAGVATVDQDYLEPAASMRASEFQIFTKVILPAILPFVMAGLRLSVGRAVVGVVVGEFFTRQSGLGGLIVQYAGSFRTAEMFVPILVLVVIGAVLTSLVGYMQRRLAPWKESERDPGI